MTLIETPKPRKPARASVDYSATLLAIISTDGLTESATRAADELAKLNAAMDRLMIARGDGVIPAVRELADQLISFLDTAAGWDEREPEHEGDDNPDDEPSLGASAGINQVQSWSSAQNTARDDCEQQDEDGDELDTLEACDLEINGESDCDGRSGTVDDEPSLGSLDGRISQKRWGETDKAPGWLATWVDIELDEAQQEGGIEDLPHDLEVSEGGNIPIGNANGAFGVAD